MSDITVAPNTVESPFESIKCIDDKGNEVWYARDLMKLMGYTNWRRFETPVNQAIENLELNGDNIPDHFYLNVKKSQGRDAQDYKLSRYACYMIALCCDGRKPEVAAAKKYFAVKTREAEVMIPQQSDRIKELELQNEHLRLQVQVNQSSLSLAQFRQTVVTMCPELVQQKILGYQVIEKTEIIEKTVDLSRGRTYSGVGIGYLTKRYGFNNNAETEAWLTRLGYGKNQTDPTGNDCSVWIEELTAHTNKVLPREYLPVLDQYLADSQRQKWIGE